MTQRLSDLPHPPDPVDPAAGDASADEPTGHDADSADADATADGVRGVDDETTIVDGAIEEEAGHLAEVPPPGDDADDADDADGPDLVPPTERIAFPIDLSTPPDGVAAGRTAERPGPTDRIRYPVRDPERPGPTDRIQYRPGGHDVEPPAAAAGAGDDDDDGGSEHEPERPPGPPAPGWAPAPAPFAPGSIGGPESPRPPRPADVDWGPTPGGPPGVPAAGGGPVIGGPSYHTTVQHQTIEQQNIAQQIVHGGTGPNAPAGGAPGGALPGDGPGDEHGDDEILSEVQAPVQARPPRTEDRRRAQQDGPQESGRLSDRIGQPTRQGRERERVVADTPALRGLPGGPGLRIDRASRGATPADRHTPGMMNPSVWQRLNLVWREAGAAWERPRRDGQPDWQPSGEAFISGRKRKELPHIPRPLLITVAGVAVVVLIIAASSLFSGGGGGGGPQDTRIGGASLADSTFALPAGAKGDGVDQGIGAIARYGNRVVISGREKGGMFDRPQFFSSSDGGATWSPGKITGPGGGAVPQGGAPTRIVGGPTGWVALNLTNVPIWSSPDGSTWTQMPDAQVATAFRDGDSVAALVARTSGFMAVGSHSSGGKVTPVVWTSDDGKTWTRSDDAQFEVSGGSAQKLYGLAIRADVLVAGGTRTRTVTKEVTVKKGKKKKKVKKKTTVNSDGFWRSTDGGSTWEAVDVPQSGGSGGYFVGLAATKDQFFALRPGSGGHNGVVMASPDGQSWKQSGTVSGGKKDNLKVTMMSGAADGLAVLGTLGNGHSVGFSSADGKSFKRLGDLGANGGRTIRGLVPVPGGLVAAGSTFGADENPYLAVADQSGKVVTSDLSKVPGARHPDHAVTGVRFAGGRYVAVGGADGDGAVWTSADGKTWRTAEASGDTFARSGTQRLSSVTSGPSGWLTVGRAGGGHPLVASSADGAKWAKLDDDKAFSGADTATNAAASGPAGYAVVGSSGADAMAWTSKDLKSWTKGDGAGLAAPKKASQAMNDVVGGSFGFVSVGSVGDDNGSRPAAWISSDGAKWTKVEIEVPDSADSASLDHVAVNGSRLVAAGTATTGDASVPFTTTSVDGGKSWQPSQPPGAATAEARATAVLPLGKGFALLTSQGEPGAAHVRLWTTDDGTSWKARPLKGAALVGPTGTQTINAAVANSGSVLGVGSTADAQSEHVTLWHAPL